jgi:hypothetical protein
MQLKWVSFNGDTYFETEVFGNRYAVASSTPWRPELMGWKIVKNSSGWSSVKEGFKTKEEAMVAAHQIIEKELEKGYRKEAGMLDSFSAKLSYIPEDMFGCKKALALFTNENGDEYIDAVLVSATIPKGSLVREVDPEHHNDLPGNGVCRKCRSDRAIIVDILEPMCVSAGETYSLPSRKTQRKKIPIISIHIVTEALRTYFTVQESFSDYYGYTARRMSHRDECAITRKLIVGYMSIILRCSTDAHIFGDWLSNIAKPGELAIVEKVLEPYMDTITRYQEDRHMLCKVLLARILRDMGIMDIALRLSYKIGDKIRIDDFDLSNNACGAGFHFFKTAIEAHNYGFN